MGFLGALFGGGGGKAAYDVTQGLPGFQFGTSKAANIQARQGTQNSIAQQQAFLNALGANGGFNANQAGVFGQQQGLANQLGALAQGQGPNPAQAMLAQNTGQNMQQQAALMAGARGAQSNPGLLARQAGQVGAQAQQQAVGQAAQMGAEQQLGAMGQLAQQQAQMGNLATAGVGQQQTALSQLGQQNLANQEMIQNALTAQNQQQVQAQAAQADIAKQGMQGGQGLVGGLLGGIGSVLTGGLFAGGGQVGSSPMPVHPMRAHSQGLAFGGKAKEGEEKKPLFQFDMGNTGSNPMYAGANQFGSAIGQGIGRLFSSPQSNNTPLPATPTASPVNLGVNTVMPSAPYIPGALGAVPSIPFASGGSVNVALSPGEKVLTPQQAQMASEGGDIQGKTVPGKAKVSGDSTKNDTFKTKLPEGTIVIPRSHADDPKKVAEFLNAHMGFNLHHRRKKTEGM